jgi:fibronectin-binding autotransporter adhesin
LNATSQGVGNLTGTGSTIVNNGGGAVTLTIGNGNFGGGNYAGVIADNNNSTAGTIALTKTGTGTITLSGANTYSGATAVSNGTLNVQNATGLGATTGGTTVSSGATLQIQGDITVGAEALTISGVGETTATGALENVSGTNNFGGLVTLGAASTISSDAGTLNLTNTGTITGASFGLTLTGAGNGSIASIVGTTTGTLTKTGVGMWTLSGANTFTGATAISNGILNIQNATALGTVAAGTTVSSGATLQVQGDITVGAEALTISGVGETTATGALENVSGTNNFGGLLKLGAASMISSDAGILNLTNAGTITGATFGLTLTGNGNGSISSIIGTTSGTLTKTGTGTWTLLAANTYTGAVTVSNGILNIQNATALGTTGGAATVSSGATLQIQNNITVGAQALTISGAGASGATGALENVSGTNNYGGLVKLGAASTISSDAGTLNLTNAGTITGATFGLTLTGSGNGILSSIIGTTTGALTKSGTGAWTLSGANTYTGATTVNGGSLFVNGSTASGSAATVNNSGSTLGGSGTVSGTVHVASSGANLSPGASGVGSTAILHTGALTLASGSNFNVDINGSIAGTGYDQVISPGAISVNGANLIVSALSSMLAVGNKYYIVEDSSNSVNTYGLFSNGATVSDNNGDIFAINYADNGDGGLIANDISLTALTVVPEPGTYAAGLLPLAALLWNQRRRLRQGLALVGRVI